MTAKRKAPPKGLGQAGKRYWVAVVDRFDPEGHELEHLRLAAEALDVAELATADIRVNGITCLSRNGDVRPNPAVAAARDARSSFARLVALLRLPDVDGMPTRGVGRPGRRLA